MQPLPKGRPSGMTAFWIVWAGQLISLLGSSMTGFALPIWAFQKTGSATALALMGVFFLAPLLVLSPVVGVMVDRHNRKLMMMLSDLAAGLVTIAIFYLYVTDALEVWHLYITALISGVFQGFQWPAYNAALAVMIPKEQYVRANSMLEIVGPASNIAAPTLAGAIFGLGEAFGFDGLQVIMLIDIVTFIAAIGALLLIHIPNPPRSADSAQGDPNFFRQAIYGFEYILQRPSLLGLQITFLLCNLFFSMSINMVTPMLLARTGNNEPLFGIINTIGAVGVVVGGLAVGAWGGFKTRVHGVLLGWAIAFLFGSVIFGLGRIGPAWMIGLWVVGFFVGRGMQALINGSNQAIWMAKVAPDVQGRVFSARRLIAWVASPLGAISGPLADFVMEPAMQNQGTLVPVFGWLVGTGPGAGMALIMVLTGVIGSGIALGMYFVPVVRHAESLLPDHQALAGDQSAASPELESKKVGGDAAQIGA